MNPLRIFGAIAALSLSAGAFAQGWPDRPISLVVGFPPGGGVDIVARQLADRLSEQLGQRVAVDNRAGANGNVAMEYVARARPDGYTMLMGNVGNLAINPALYSKLGFDTLKDFAPISRVIVQPLVAVVPSASPITNLAQLLAALRARPGEFNFGSGGNGNINHLSGELLKLQAGVQFTHVPYKGSAPAVADLVAGRMHLMIDGANVMTSFVRDGRLRAIYTTGEARSPAYPDVPTAREAGLPDMVVYGWQGVLAPAGTPAAVIERMSQEIARALAQPELRNRLAAQGTEPAPLPPAQFQAFLAAEHRRYGEVVRSAKVSLD
ncbi:MAG: tripartite tricarboxylate transporter substrate binding protein [Burkholderiales bacterium]|nr:tripartite tricarboxylate transporter substrate binding protein [Burkholderiales bacterium]